MVIEVQDKYSKWSVALVTCCILGEINKVKIHYYHLNERFDEWFEESPENLLRLLPYGASGRTEDLRDRILTVNLMHRRSSDDINQQIIGLPYCINLASNMTWNEIDSEIRNQIARHVPKL